MEEENAPIMKMNLFAFSRKKVFTLTAALFSFWVIFLIASIWFVPPIYEEVRSVPQAGIAPPPPGRGASFVWALHNLSRYQQQLYLEAVITKTTPSSRFILDVQVSVHMSGMEEGSNEWLVIADGSSNRLRSFDCTDLAVECDRVLLAHIPYIDYSSYRMNVTFLGLEDELAHIEKLDYIWRMRNDQFTFLEVFFRFGTLLFSCTVTALYIWRMRRFHRADWSYEQKWTAFLLFLLIGFNNPIFPVSVMTDSAAPLFIDSLLQTTFVAGLLLYWICLFHGMRRIYRPIGFYLPKLFLVGTLWVAVLVVTTWEHMNLVEDPSYHLLSDIDGFKAFVIIFGVFAGLYLITFGYHVLRTVGRLQSADIDMRLKVVITATIVVLVVSIVGLALTVFGVFSLSLAFFSYYTLFNIYIAFQSHIYAPADDMDPLEGEDDEYGMEQMDDEKEEGDADASGDAIDEEH